MAGIGLSEWTVERAGARDASRVAQLMASMYDPAELPYTIWSSPRIERYVADRIEDRRADDAPQFSVIRRAGIVDGVILLRTIDDAIFVDGIYTDPAARRGQLTNLLVFTALKEYARLRPAESVRFDGAESKPAVRAWQCRVLGAMAIHRKTWWRLPVESPGSGRYELAEVDEADRLHERWGFSTIRVKTPRCGYAIGRLPGAHYRLTDPGGVTDPDLMAALAALDPARDLIAIGDSTWEPEGGRFIDAFVRSEVRYVDLLRRVRAQIPALMLGVE